MTDKLRVLQIEDSQVEAQLIVQILQEQAYQVEALSVHNAEDLQHALAQAWDVIICNHQLHDFDPYAALKILQKNIWIFRLLSSLASMVIILR